MDENKINKEQKYSVSSIYQTLNQAFDSYHLRKEDEPDGTLVFYVKCRKCDRNKKRATIQQLQKGVGKHRLYCKGAFR